MDSKYKNGYNETVDDLTEFANRIKAQVNVDEPIDELTRITFEAAMEQNKRYVDSKYYTPEIEEFHVGLEYELFDHGQGRWHSYIFEPKQKIQPFEEFIEGDEVRVKYLDREDIENCGWEYTGETNSELPWTYKITYSDGIYNAYLHHYFTEGGVSVIMITGSEYGDVTLNIRNISELRRLMKQLNIS